ncbi:MFS transporter [Alkalihalobacillus sp. MEB130]|uniref:MFS transporter n=1 Tax=Alkalihalobacillus sp. MEB130 TaxID=2976704 RepID=UPI0028DECD5F|nr:MFS transporter [Alkalihalobacillus sp. MEB130]MDT8858690.1 MFS transporter [Alkalihalobacillus sp. MEB130]
MGRFVGEWNEQFKNYNHNVRLFLLASILVNIGMGIFMVIYNYYIRELGYSDQMNGRVIAMQAMASAVALLPAGLISDKWGRKRIIIIGAVFAATSLLFRALLEGEQTLIVMAFVTGLFMAFIQVSSIPLLAENSTEKERVHLFSFNFALIMVANVVGNALGGTLTDLFHLFFHVTMLESVRITLVIGSVFFFLALIPIFKIKDQSKARIQKTGASSIGKLLTTHRSSIKWIGLFAVANLLIGFGSGLVIPYLNLYFSDRFEISNSLVGLILSLGQAMTAVAFMIGPSVVKRFGEVKAVVMLQLASIPFLLLTAYTENLWLAVIGFLFRQALMNAGNPIQMALMMRTVDDSMKGLANSVGQMVFQLGWAVMGPVSTSIVVLYGAYYGYAYVFSITAFLYVLGSTYFFFVFRQIDSKKTQKEVA